MTAAAGGEEIRALATVTLDAQALEELGPRTIDRLADLVAARLAERRAAGEAPLLTAAEAAELAGVHPGTVRRAVRTGALRVVGYVGQRPRMRREDVEAWVAAGEPPWPEENRVSSPTRRRCLNPAPRAHPRVLGDALRSVTQGGAG